MTQNRRLIEVNLPLVEISAQSSREKSIRHGHISTLHIWWARRPLAACRAAVFATLMDAPEDEAEREKLEDLIATIVDWDHVKDGNSPKVEQAKALIREQFGGRAPRVLDPFAGGGAIPLEAQRLGCEAHAVDLNPVAHLIELCTLVYPQKYAGGVPGPSQAPEQGRLPGMEPEAQQLRMAGLEQPAGERTLASDVERWGNWVLEQARAEIGQFYENPVGDDTIVAYLWARTVKCPNPACGATMPLVKQFWLRRKRNKTKVALKPVVDYEGKQVSFEVVRGKDIDFDPSRGTSSRGSATCLVCNQVADVKYVRAEGKAGRMGQMPLAVVTTGGYGEGKGYRPFTPQDVAQFEAAQARLEKLEAEHEGRWSLVPDEPLPAAETLGFRVQRYGITKWGHLFSPRQALTLVTFAAKVREVYDCVLVETDDANYACAIATYLSVALDRQANQTANICRWHNTGEKLEGVFSRQALPMVWDYAEVNPFSGSTGDWTGALDWITRVIEHCSYADGQPADAQRGTVTRLSYPEGSFDAVVTDPPYYDAVPYADLSDFFYVWLKRTVGELYPAIFRSPLAPKSAEIIQEPARHADSETAKDFYEQEMTQAFREIHRVLTPEGRCAVMFAHKTTSAWETLITGLLEAELVTTASWPLHTEMGTRLRAHDSAALASSILLICRKRDPDAGVGYYDDIRRQLEDRIRERLDFFWAQGIRGSDFFISAIGPALEVFGRYAEVRRLSGEPVTVGEFLTHVREIVTDYALSQVLRDGGVGAVDPATRFYVLWRWAYAGNQVPFDDGRVLAQALGAEIDDLMHKTDLLQGRTNLKLRGPKQRSRREEDLGEPKGGIPAPLIDVVQRACALWEKGERVALSEFLSRSLHGREETFWNVAQSLSEILPEGDKEKQMLHGLLVSQDRLPDVSRQERLL